MRIGSSVGWICDESTVKSRQTSPLWNAEKFTREMERAYEQMWEIYRNQ